MPISSGALGWPASHFSKQEDDVSQNATVGLDNGGDVNDQIWKVQLTDRDEYDRWKDQYNKMEKKLRKKKKKKKRKEMEKREKEQLRDDAAIVLQRHRRRRCLMLSCCLLVAFSTLFYGLLYLYTNFLEEDSLVPVVAFQNTAECGGIWRKHFLVFSNTLPNGTHIYYCCFMPDINATARHWVLSQGDAYPAGFMIRQNDCNPSGQNCEDFEKANTFPPGTPPCSSMAAADVRMTTTTGGLGLLYLLPLSVTVATGSVSKLLDIL